MGLKVTGISTTALKLQSQAGRTNKAALQEMIAGGQLVHELAVMQAPVDDGNLEEAIKLEIDAANPLRASISIYVDEDMSVPGRPGKTVGDYALRMHEGDYQLGSISQLKQDSNPGVIVGRKYIQRAIEELQQDIETAMQEAVKSSIWG